MEAIQNVRLFFQGSAWAFVTDYYMCLLSGLPHDHLYEARGAYI